MKTYLGLFTFTLLLSSSCQVGLNPANPSGSNTSIPKKTVISYQDRENKQYPQILVPGLELKVIAGNGEAAYKDGPALEASFNYLAGLAKDDKGNLYIVDQENDRIRKLSTNKIVTTLAGTGSKEPIEKWTFVGKFEEIDIAPLPNISFWNQDQLIINSAGDFYQLNLSTGMAELFLDRDKQNFNSEVEISTLPFSMSNFDFERSVVNQNDLYLLDPNDIAKVNKTEKGYRWLYLAGGTQWLKTIINPRADYAFKDGPVSQAVFNGISDLGFDQSGNMYIADSDNQRIRKLNVQTQQVTTLSGQNFLGNDDGFNYSPPLVGGFRDGAFKDALFEDPTALEVLAPDELLVCDENQALRYLFNGQVKTILKNIKCLDLLKDGQQILISDALHHRIYSMDIQQLTQLKSAISNLANIDQGITPSY